ncbi:MAG: YetF domain-containing protein [Cyanobacteria bacterium P01_D01_bin.1]
MDYSLTSDLFGEQASILHTLIVGTLSYLGVIVWLRISGKRTLSKWNSFDFVVTVAFGSVLASSLLSTNTSWLQAMLAVGMLVVFQYVLTWLSVRTTVVQRLLKAEPTLLVFNGKFLKQPMKEQRVAEGEVLAAIRLSGGSSIEDTDAVILETNGNFSVVKNLDVRNASALRDVRGFRAQAVKQL